MSVIRKFTATGYITSGIPLRIKTATAKAGASTCYARIFDGMPGGGGSVEIPLECDGGKFAQVRYENKVLQNPYIDIGGNPVDFIELEVETP